MPAQGRAHPGLGERSACLAAAALLAAADQASKSWAFSALPARDGTLDVLPPVFSFTLSRNQGIVMGIGHQIGGVFTVTSFVMLAVLAYLIWTKAMPWHWRLSLAAIASGALGNGLDRLRLHYVRDFLDVHYHGLVYPTFNVADSCICVGATVLAIGLWRTPDAG